MAASFRHLLECISKSNNSISYAQTKREECRNLIEETTPKLETIVAQTKVLQVQIEKALSKQYNGRVVNIVGEINNL